MSNELYTVKTGTYNPSTAKFTNEDTYIHTLAEFTDRLDSIFYGDDPSEENKIYAVLEGEKLIIIVARNMVHMMRFIPE